MISIKQLNKKDVDLCYEFDLNTISLWNKNQWANEFKKESAKIFVLLFEKLVIGICVYQVVLDEVQINYLVVNQKFRKRGFGSFLMKHLIKRWEKQSINKLVLEVSQNNLIDKKFYCSFDFYTVGKRRNYYKDGSDALLKEKILTTK